MKVNCILKQHKIHPIKSWINYYCYAKHCFEISFIDLFLLLKANYNKLPIIFANIRV